MKRAKRILAVILGIALLCSTTAGETNLALASSTSETTETTETTDKPESEMTEEEKAKAEREKEIQAAYDLPVQTNELKGWPKGPSTYGEAGIVMDVDSGAILYAKNIDKKEYPASITKVLTALLAFEYGNLADQVTISPEAIACLRSGYASIGLKEGNQISMEQALYAMLLASANEAAYAVGETVAAEQGQDYNWFISQMNERCSQLGCVNSNFVNTNGIFDENHYTCARDMALIGRALFDYPLFFQICQTEQYVIPQSDTVEEHVFQQKHQMLLKGNEDYADDVIGGKTGYTVDAENTLITMADNGEMRLVCVILKTYYGHSYSDTRALLDYVFNNFSRESVGDYENSNFGWIEDNACVVLPEGIDFDKLDCEIELYDDGTNGATASYYYKDTIVGQCQVMVSESYKEGSISKLSEEKEAGQTDKSSKQTGSVQTDRELYKAVIAIAAAAALLFCGIISIVITRILRKRKKRRNRKK